MSDTTQLLSALQPTKKRRFTMKRILGTLALVTTTAAVSAKIARSEAFADPEPETKLESAWPGNTV